MHPTNHPGDLPRLSVLLAWGEVRTAIGRIDPTLHDPDDVALLMDVGGTLAYAVSRLGEAIAGQSPLDWADLPPSVTNGGVMALGDLFPPALREWFRVARPHLAWDGTGYPHPLHTYAGEAS